MSVLLVARNSENSISRCVDSILRQDYPRLQLVLVDNCSSDRTGEIIAERYPSVEFLSMSQATNHARCCNAGMARCSGEFVYLMGSDMELAPGAIKDAVQRIDLAPHIALVASPIETRSVKASDARPEMEAAAIRNENEGLGIGMRFIAAPGGDNFLIRKHVADSLGYLFDERMNSDLQYYDLGLRCWAYGYLCLCSAELEEDLGELPSRFPRHDKNVKQELSDNLSTAWKCFGKREFISFLLKTLPQCVRLSGFLGLAGFFRSIGAYRSSRSEMQAMRKLDDATMRAIADGFCDVLAREKGSRRFDAGPAAVFSKG